MMTETTHNTFTELHHALSPHPAEVVVSKETSTPVKTTFDAWERAKASKNLDSLVAFLENLKKDYHNQNPLAPVSRKLWFLEETKRYFVDTDKAVLTPELLWIYLANIKSCIDTIKTSTLHEDKNDYTKNWCKIVSLLKFPMAIDWNDKNLALYLDMLNSISHSISPKEMAELLHLPQNILWSLTNLKSYLRAVDDVKNHVENLLPLLKISTNTWDLESFQTYLTLLQTLEKNHLISAGVVLELLLPKQGAPWVMGDFLASNDNRKAFEDYAKYIYTFTNKGVSDEDILALIALKTKSGMNLGHLLVEANNGALIKLYFALLVNLVNKGQTKAVLDILQVTNSQGETILHILAKNSMEEFLGLFEALNRISKTDGVFQLMQLQDASHYNLGHHLNHRVDIASYFELLAKFSHHDHFFDLLSAATEDGTTLLHKVAGYHSASLINKYWNLIDKLPDTKKLDLIEMENLKGMTAGDILIANHHHEDALYNYLFKLRMMAKKGDEIIKNRVNKIMGQEFEKNIAILSSEPKNFTRYESILGDFLKKLASSEWKTTFEKLCNVKNLALVERSKEYLERFLDFRMKLHSHGANTDYQTSADFTSISFKKPWLGVKAATKAVWKEIDPKFLMEVIRKGTFKKEEYAYFAFCKEKLKDYILEIKKPELKAKLIAECLDEATVLGQFFHTSRGWLKPSINRGILGKLFVESKNLSTTVNSNIDSHSNSYSSILESTGSSLSTALIAQVPSDTDMSEISGDSTPTLSVGEQFGPEEKPIDSKETETAAHVKPKNADHSLDNQRLLCVN